MGSPTPATVVPPDEAPARKQLNLWDATSIIVGIIIGSGFYETSPLIAGAAGTVGWMIAAWLAGAAVSLIGALCYAELATTYPKDGGDYVFLTRAFGRHVGFLFAWSGFWIVRPGNIAAMAFIFARYAGQLWPLGKHGFTIYAAGSVVILTVVNILGVRSGKRTQNVLTVAKLVGLAAVFVFAMLAPNPDWSFSVGRPRRSLELAMIFVLFAYGGWNDIAYVAAEVRDARRNILRALLLGIAAVAAVYVLGNVAFTYALGFEDLKASHAVAADVMAARAGPWGAKFISGLICVSCLGAINGMVLTGARIFYAVGVDHRPFAWLGEWNRRLGSPVRSLAIQGTLTLAMVLIFGVYKNGFEQLVIFTSPLFNVFFLLSGISLFVLRARDRHLPRVYPVPGYPVTPLLFCAFTGFMIYATVTYAWKNSTWGIWVTSGVMLVGIALSLALPPREPAERATV